MAYSYTQRYDRQFLAGLDREGLRRALRLLRREAARPMEANYAAAQYFRLATTAAGPL